MLGPGSSGCRAWAACAPAAERGVWETLASESRVSSFAEKPHEFAGTDQTSSWFVALGVLLAGPSAQTARRGQVQPLSCSHFRLRCAHRPSSPASWLERVRTKLLSGAQTVLSISLCVAL